MKTKTKKEKENKKKYPLAHQIVIHTLQFMKLYLTDYFRTHQLLPAYLSREKVVSGATSVCGLQRNSSPSGKEATQSQFT